MVTVVKSLCFSFIILASFATPFAIADARRFYVGGNGVWVINPQENYKTWAERNRFQVNDTLYFKYVKGSDSVQQVMKADFDGCNIRNPIMNFDDGEAIVTLDRSGPFYLISGNEDHCKKGQKLIVVVLAIRNHTKNPISPAKPPKSHSPVSSVVPSKPPAMVYPPKSPSTAQPPKSTSPVPHNAPATSPSKSQPPKSSVSPTQSPKSSSPVSHSPVVSPSHAPSMSPATPSPSPKFPSPANSPKPSSSPVQAPTSPPLSPSPSDTTPTSDNSMTPAPAPSHKNSSSDVAVTSVMTSILSVAFTVLMLA